MKKIYNAPIVEIEKFEIFNILTTSGGQNGNDTETDLEFFDEF